MVQLQPTRATRKMIFLLSYTKLREKRTEQVGQMSLKQARGERLEAIGSGLKGEGELCV